MNRVTFPLKLRMDGPKVTDLHEALIALLERNSLRVDSGAARRELVAGLESERAQKFYGNNTSSVVQLFQRQQNLEVTGEVDEPTAALINQLLFAEEPEPPERPPFMVSGRVTYADGKPFTLGVVRAYDRDLRREELLGQSKLDERGYYAIHYGPGQFARAEKASADLRVCAYTGDGKELASSPILFNAGRQETVDLVVGNEVYRGPSEYEELVEELSPLLQDLSFAELTEDEEHQDITFLGGETGRDPLHISLLARAHGLWRRTDVPAEVFFGLFREGLPTSLRALLAQSPDVHRRALSRAIDRNIIPASFGERVDGILDQFNRLVVKETLEQSEDGTVTRLPELLDTVLESSHEQETFISAYMAHTGPIEEFWKSLDERPEFRDKVGDLQFTLQVSGLSNNHLPLVHELQRMKQAGKIKTLSDLARFDEKDWLKVIGENGDAPVGFPPDVPGRDDGEKARNYARAMTRMVEDAFPTAALTYRLAQDDLEGKEALLNFFRTNQDFDFKVVRLENYLAENPSALDGIPRSQQATLKQQVKAVQRLYKVAPSYADMSTLLKDGFDSAYAISRMGKTSFALKYGEGLGGQEQAKVIYERAQQTTATAMVMLSDYAMPTMQTATSAVPEVTFDNAEGIPDWPSLFGSLDLCECAQCRSVYSPAAYLVDLLHFLEDRRLVDTITRDAQGNITKITYKRKTLPGGSTKDKSALDVLFERRPDVGEIELTCENTNMPLPYVDLVNEVLEDFVASFAPFTPFVLATARESDLDTRNVSLALRNAFTPNLSEQAVITVKKKGTWWTIDDLPFTYTVRKESGSLRVKVRHRQTNGTAEERAANPQYMVPQAYNRLRQQVFPWELPFDLWVEEAGAYLDHLGVKRHDVMEAMLPGDRATLLDNMTIAREHLGLTPAEADLITGVTTSQAGAADPGVWNLWGFAKATLDATHAIPDPADSTKWIKAGNWLNVLVGRVDVLLQQSGLKYKDLLDLLMTRAINPLETTGDRTIAIQSTDSTAQDTCELKKLKLTGLDQATAVKISRFVRLWRKLGWSVYDLDRAVSALNSADIDDSFLKQLSQMKRLQQRLNVSVDQLVTFWAPMDTTVYVDHHSEGQPILPSLYTRLFRNKTVINPLDPAFTEDPAEMTGALSDHVGPITAALGISAEDFSLLFGDSHVIPRDASDSTRPDDRLTLDHLSRLFRHSTLAGALKLKVRDYLSILALYGGDPFTSSVDTVLFTEHVDRIRDSGFSISRLDYLLRHTAAAITKEAPTDDAIAIVLGDLRAGAQTIATENTFRSDPTDPNGATVDLNGELTLSKLALLNWDKKLVDEVVSTFNDAVTYRAPLAVLPPGLVLPNDTVSTEAPLAALPAGFSLPGFLKEVITYDGTALKLKALRYLNQAERTVLLDASADASYQAALLTLFQNQDELQGKASYDATAGELTFTGAMTLLRRAKLKSVSTDTDYLDAIDALFEAPRQFVRRNLRTFFVPTFSESLPGLPASVAFPAVLKGRIYFDSTTGKLHFEGAMTKEQRETLLALSTSTADPNHVAYQAAVNALFVAPDTLVPEAGDTFLTTSGAGNDMEALFDHPSTPEARYERLLKKLLPYLRVTLSRRLVTLKLSEALQLEAEVAEKLLTTWIDWPAHAGQKAIEAFLTASFVESDPNLSIERSAFGDQFDSYTLLHKLALVITTLELTTRQLRWLFEYGSIMGWPQLEALPLALTGPATTVLPKWERLWEFCKLRDTLPRGAALLEKLFTLAHGVTTGASDADKNTAKTNIVELLRATLGWTEDNLESLVGSKADYSSHGLLNATFPDDFQDERLLERLSATFSLMKRLGMSADQCGVLANASVTESVARDVRQAVRAKYDDAQWLELAQPLRDVLREKQRAALVAHLVAHPDTSHRWRDVNDVYAHFLIDVEMSPCQLTSRIKQAISAVQLFAQRALMHLEPEVLAGTEVDEKWREWKWMKNYRVWEANRKVFLYPENWIEPELRDDKTAFFKSLESDLLQGDVTKETAEEAFLSYVEKLDLVAHLEIVGMYHQVEEDLTGNKAVDILHVFGRTHASPHTYYYRQRVDSSYWTAWERVDLDIEGNHLIPAVWNRRLYLFWPVFTEKARPMGGGSGKVTELDASDINPGKYWEIGLAWSERKQSKWTNKKTSTASVEIDKYEDLTDDLSQYFFKWFVDDENRLTIMVLHPLALFAVAFGGKPWAFQFDGCNADPAVTSAWKRLLELVNGTDFHYMFLQENGEKKLYLPTPTDTAALNKTPGTFRLLVYADGSSIASHPSFYQDDRRTFFVVPSDVQVPLYEWKTPEEVDPGIRYIPKDYYLKIPIFDPVGPVINPNDPVLFEPSVPVAPDPNPVAVSIGAVVQPGYRAALVMARGERTTTPLKTMRAALPFELVGEGLGAGPTMYANTGVSAIMADTYAGYAAVQDGLYGTSMVPVFRSEKHFTFQTFYHPYVSVFVRELNRHGVDGLLQRKVQTDPHVFLPRPPSGSAPKPLDFKKTYEPDKVSHPVVDLPYPVEDVDFTRGGGYSLYNWELFFHAPLLIADRLSQNQRFEDAQKWFHYIFDPTDTSGLAVPQRYWRTRPFFEKTDEQYQKESIPNLLRFLANRGDATAYAKLTSAQRMELEELEDQVKAWRKDPFKPHLVARLRTTAYQKTVVMKYIDNLIAWGDQLFRRDTMESINEATQLYILAAELLGKRPEEIPPRAIANIHTYNTLRPKLDAFSNALVQIEEFVPPSVGSGTTSSGSEVPLTLPTMLYFCAPKNSKLLGYWDTVADRLFKIRHCMNIEGVVRQLSLFAPPIDPGLLVKAVAAGIDISSALSDINAALPHYRFNTMSQKATELCAEVKALGGALLAALEKRDAEELALLRSEHEIALLKRIEQVKKDQLTEATESLGALRKSRDVAAARYVHYQKLLGVQSPQVPAEGETIAEQPPSPHVSIKEEGGIKIIPHEEQEMEKLQESDDAQDTAGWIEFASSIAHVVPNFNIEPWGIGATFGGSNVGAALSAIANRFRANATEANFEANLSAKLGQYALRAHDWVLQSNVAAREIMQIDKQIVAAELREAVAERELSNHCYQQEQAQEIEETLRDKYTNQELYSWMVGQISGLYFQAYQLAYDVAKQAERAYRHELALSDSNFIQFGYWDSLKKGLLAGERLHQDIKRMEVAYLEQHKREYELTKHVSLSQLDPVSLVQLKETGECFIGIPEALFDMDYPGHYTRRIKSVSVTIPCVSGPYTGVPCTLTLTSSSIRHSNTTLSGKYARQDSDPRFTDSVGAIQSIVTSSGQEDSGLFETNMRDERYLPFEGAGVISRWQLKLPAAFRPFDYNTISDVILHLRYTAREAGGVLGQQAVTELQAAVNAIARASGDQGLARLFDARHEFSTEWYRFLHPSADITADQTLILPLSKERFPYVFQGSALTIDKVELFVKVNSSYSTTYDESTLKLSLAAGTASSSSPVTFTTWKGLLRAETAVSGSPGTWTLTGWLESVAGTHEALDADALEDLVVVCHYSV